MSNEISIKAMAEAFRTDAGDSLLIHEPALLRDLQSAKKRPLSLAIKILSVAGGFLAAIAFLGFVMASGMYKSETAMLVIGLIFIIGSTWLNKKTGSLVWDTFSITGYIIGYIMTALGLSDFHVNDQVIALLFILIAAVMLMISDSYMFTFLSVLVISISCLFIIADSKKEDLIHVYIIVSSLLMTCWILSEAKILKAHQKISGNYTAIRDALVVTFWMGLIFVCKTGLFNVTGKYLWISSLVLIPLVLVILNETREMLRIQTNKEKLLAGLMSLIILLPTINSPAIMGAILITLASYLVHFKTGFFLGIISLIYFIGQYYYDLEFSLLTKSILMFVTGILFLAVFFITRHKLIPDEKK